MNSISFVRQKPPPYGSLLFVYYTGTQDQVPLWADEQKTTPVAQPVVMFGENIKFYCDNTRVDFRIVHQDYPNGEMIIRDNLIFDHDNAEHLIDGGSID